MGKVSQWLLEMQEYAAYLLDKTIYSVDECRAMFKAKYPGQEIVFENVLAEFEQL